MLVKFGYVAMSEKLQNASPSQTMTATQFSKLQDTEAAIRRLEKIAKSNLSNCLRLLKHNAAYDIDFFRLSSRLVPLVNHPLTEGWKYEKALMPQLKEIGQFVNEREMRIDFHPDHFVVLNNKSKEIFQRSLQTLLYHYKLLKGMGIDPKHRCVLHIGGAKEGKLDGLETFVDNFSDIPKSISQMIMLENDDTIYTIEDALYLGEKLEIPVIVDLHHHDINPSESHLSDLWERVLATWERSPLTVKIHVSSPRDGDMDKSHHDFINPERLLLFFEMIASRTKRLDVMIEAKKKDEALLQLMEHLKEDKRCIMESQASITFQ
ncbi:UV DNA damage repair endonuclease UvsE [Bacillus alkalicellulosilyticus]|uniref:UV DNA damage repair endonuclease UvsE n=1 Tax=Alkalihalobacterium alkalicellulosilyticum TaxID=1912214 RepID=UPI000997E028|nr:UV DNA damage repair endonuclease UvsE [Bacillus alkalicellulosilyticus]